MRIENLAKILAEISNEDTFTKIEPLKIVTRAEWNAREPKTIVDMTNPVPFVIIHHSYIPGPCNTSVECEEAMRKMQDMHMDDREWFDVGYR